MVDAAKCPIFTHLVVGVRDRSTRVRALWLVQIHCWVKSNCFRVARSRRDADRRTPVVAGAPLILGVIALQRKGARILWKMPLLCKATSTSAVVGGEILSWACSLSIEHPHGQNETEVIPHSLVLFGNVPSEANSVSDFVRFHNVHTPCNIWRMFSQQRTFLRTEW